MALQEIQFRADGLDERDIRKWRRFMRASPPVRATSVAGWTLAALAVGYSIRHDFPQPVADPEVPVVVEVVPPDDVVRGVVQVVPPVGSTSASACTPAIFFLGQPYPDETELSVTVTGASGDTLDIGDPGSLVRLSSAAGNTILVLAPGEPYPAGASVSVSIVQQDPGGQPFGAEATFTIRDETPALTGVRELEEGGDAVWGQGDFAQSLEAGVPGFLTAGPSSLALSTGQLLGGSSIDSRSSFVSLGPLRPTRRVSLGPFGLGSRIVRLRFEYDFMSLEFDEFVGTVYDDAFVVVISGPGGVEARLVTSVNLIGEVASVVPEGGGAEHTEWREFLLTAEVGSPACVTFMITDVGDDRLESLVAIRSLSLD